MRREVVLSDFSGAEIPVGTGAVVTIKFRDPGKRVRVRDLSDQEAERLGGRLGKRRGAQRTGYSANPAA